MKFQLLTPRSVELFEPSTPLARKELGYGWTCPYCLVAKDEWEQTGVYYLSRPVCETCAPILAANRDAARKATP